MIKPIPWYKFYSISDDWIIYYKWIEKHTYKSKKWYVMVYINWLLIQVHRLVALTFFWDIEWKVVMHLDDNPSNNCVGNLKIGTQKENLQDMINKGRNKMYGKYTGINPKEKEEIINSWLSTKEIVEIYWVHRNTVLFWKKKLWVDTKLSSKYSIEFIEKVINTEWSNISIWKTYWISDMTVHRWKLRYL